MVAACENCGRKVVFGRNVSHSGVKTPRVFKPNLQRVSIYRGGKWVRMRLCTRCIKRFRAATLGSPA